MFFRQFVHTNRYVCVLVLIHFKERLHIDAVVLNENTQRISVDGRPKRIERFFFFFFLKNALVISLFPSQ